MCALFLFLCCSICSFLPTPPLVPATTISIFAATTTANVSFAKVPPAVCVLLMKKQRSRECGSLWLYSRATTAFFYFVCASWLIVVTARLWPMLRTIINYVNEPNLHVLWWSLRPLFQFEVNQIGTSDRSKMKEKDNCLRLIRAWNLFADGWEM